MTRRRFWATLAAPLVSAVVPLRTVPRFTPPRVPPMAEVWVLFERMLG